MKIEDLIIGEDGIINLITFNGIILPFTKDELVEFINKKIIENENIK